MFLLIFSIERKESGITMASQNPMLKRYVAAMVMGGVGDSLGYYRGSWEFNFQGTEIHKEVKKLGGLKKIKNNSKFASIFVLFTSQFNTLLAEPVFKPFQSRSYKEVTDDYHTLIFICRTGFHCQ